MGELSEYSRAVCQVEILLEIYQKMDEDNQKSVLNLVKSMISTMESHFHKQSYIYSETSFKDQSSPPTNSSMQLKDQCCAEDKINSSNSEDMGEWNGLVPGFKGDKPNVLCEMNSSEIQSFDNQTQSDVSLKCQKCDIIFPTALSLKRHADKHLEDSSPCSCRICQTSFSSTQNFQAHECYAQSNMTQSSLKNSKENVPHINKKLEHKCRICDKIFLRRVSLLAHYNSHLSPNEVVCLQCGEFIHKDWFSYHVQSLHGADDQNSCCYTCSHCFSQFISQGKFQKHMLDRHNQQVYPCEFCGRQFNSAYSLSEHTESHPVGPFKCNKCSSSFSSRRLYSRHISVHRSKEKLTRKTDKKYICEYCASLFPCKQALNRHVHQLHSDSSPQKCPYCSYSSKSDTNLKRHINLHLDNKKYVCEICAATFNAKNHLKEHHLYVHSDERSYSCSVCSKSFKNKSALRRHGRVHSESRPYICGVCSQNYKRMSHLKRHMHNSHGISVKPQRPERIKSCPEATAPAHTKDNSLQANSISGSVDSSCEIPSVISIDIPPNSQLVAISTSGQEVTTSSLSYLFTNFVGYPVNGSMVMPVKAINNGEDEMSTEGPVAVADYSDGLANLTFDTANKLLLPPCATLLPPPSKYYESGDPQFQNG